MKSASLQPPKVETSGNLTIITFTAGLVRDVEDVIARELEGLTDRLGECHMLLDFTNVTFITSIELGTLVSLHQKLKRCGGRLTLFNLSLKVFEVFSICRLDKLLKVCR